jgi:hypothetical protein
MPQCGHEQIGAGGDRLVGACSPTDGSPASADSRRAARSRRISTGSILRRGGRRRRPRESRRWARARPAARRAADPPLRGPEPEVAARGCAWAPRGRRARLRVPQPVGCRGR